MDTRTRSHLPTGYRGVGGRRDSHSITQVRYKIHKDGTSPKSMSSGTFLSKTFVFKTPAKDSKTTVSTAD